MLDQDAILELLREARAAKEFAYAPYSGFRVGASVLMEDGRIFSGCNVENAAYGDTICAERTAILKAVSNGSRTLVAIAITGDSAELTYPCGSCRQVIHVNPAQPPIGENHWQYEKYYEIYRSLYPALKESFSSLAAL